MLAVASNQRSSEEEQEMESNAELLSPQEPNSIDTCSDGQTSAATEVLRNSTQHLGPPITRPRKAMEEASIYMDKAHSLMDELLSKITYQDLNQSISVLRQVVHVHASYPKAVEVLADALSLRCASNNQAIDLQESLNLYQNTLDKSSGNPPSSGDPDYGESEGLMKMAHESLTQFRESISLNTLEIIISLFRSSHAIFSRKLPEHSRSYRYLTLALYFRFQHTKELSDLDDIVFYLQHVFNHSDENVERPKTVQLLCCALASRYASSKNASDLKEALQWSKNENKITTLTSVEEGLENYIQIVHGLHKQLKEGILDDVNKATQLSRKAISRIDVDHSDYPVALAVLAALLITQSNNGSIEHNIDQGIMLIRRALELSPSNDDTTRIQYVYRLSSALQTRSKQKHQQYDLDESISILRTTLGSLTALHPDRPLVLYKLATSLEVQFEHSTKLSYLDEAILLHKEVIQSLPLALKTYRSVFLNSLAATLQIRFKNTKQRIDIEEAITLHEEILQDFPQSPFDTDRLIHLVRLISALQTLCRQSKKLDDIDKCISTLRYTFEYLPESHEMRDEVLLHLADNFGSRFQITQEQSDLDEEIFSRKQLLQLCDATGLSTERWHTFNNLGYALTQRFHLLSLNSDLDEAICFHRKALKLRPPPHSDGCTSLINLASFLESRFQLSGERPDLDEAISLNETAANIYVAPHPKRETILDNLANALETLFNQTGQLKDLKRSIVLHEEALKLRPPSHPDRPSSLNNLGQALHTHFKHTGQLSDLDHSIAMHREALEYHVPAHPHRSYSLDNLAVTLTERFENTGQRADLEEAVLLHREAFKLRTPSHFDLSLTLNNLAYTLQARFTVLSQQEDLDEAISLHRAALQLRSVSHPSRHMSLNNLANALMTRFDNVGKIDDLNQSIALHKEALERRTAPHPDRASSLMNLASAFGTHFAQTGQRRSLDDAILCYREALQIYPKTHPLRPMCLNNLANRLFTARSGNRIPGQQDTIVEEAILLITEALTLRSPPHPDWLVSVFHLSGLLEARSEHLPPKDRYESLEKAIILCKGALDLLTPHHVDRQAYVLRVATLLEARYKVAGHKEDIDQAISLQKQELASQPEGPSHPNRVILLTNLASALQLRFSRADHNQADFEECVELNEKALDGYPLQHPGRFTCLANLGKVFHHAYRLLRDPRYLEESFASFALAMKCPSKRPSTSFETVTLWSDYADQYHHRSALVAYDVALRSLTEMAPFNMGIYERQNVLRAASDGLARKAAQSAITYSSLDQAVVLLEQGRAIFWSQVLHLRSPLDELRTIAPELAQNLQTIAEELERGFYRNTLDTVGIQSKISLEREESRYRRLDEDWRNSLMEARKLKEFEDFLQPPDIRTLRAVANKIPIVFLLPNVQHSDCLIMSSTGIHHVPLSDVSIAVLRNLVDLINLSTPRSTARRSLFDHTDVDEILDNLADEFDALGTQRSTGAFSRRKRQPRSSSNSVFEYVLKTLWLGVVKPILDFLRLQKSDSPPILHWCPTGIFTFLPLHAAGLYSSANMSSECAHDYIVSSYIPTATSLIPQHEHSTFLPTQSFKMMTVFDTKLPFASDETARIKAQIPSHAESIVELGTAKNPATIEAVCSHLQSASMVHFTCHGTQDQTNPLDSALFIDNGKLTISKIMQFRPPQGSLAFLCACETGMGDATIPDESMSLGATLLFCGYRSVVATMWKMTDEDGPIISETFYKELFKGPDGVKASEPDIRMSARALHSAVLKLRSNEVDFCRWVPFIHMGRGD